MASLLFLLRREALCDSPKHSEDGDSGTSTAMCSPRSKAPRRKRQPRRRAEREGASQQPPQSCGVVPADKPKDKPKKKSKEKPAPPHVAYRFKTELCKNFQAGEVCVFGDRCCFAHGEEELRAAPEYFENEEAKSCQDFEDGFCREGMDCPLSHRKSPNKHQVILEHLEQNILLELAEGKTLKACLSEDTQRLLHSLNDNVLSEVRATWSLLLIHKRI